MIDELLTEVQAVIKDVERVSFPAGSLRTRRMGKVVRYFKRNAGETDGKYLSKEDQVLIKQLEEKEYYLELLKVAQEEEKSLEEILRLMGEMPDYKSVFLKIPEERRHLISPYDYTPSQQEEPVRLFRKKTVSEDLKLITQNGEHVRSKSELIIADRLRSNKIPYFYEDPVIMSNDGDGIKSCLYWHPDFRVQNIRTGKLYYWEHFGLLDNAEYCTMCQEKMETYAKYGYYPGENLIITSESSGHSLNLEYVDRLISKYLV